MGAVKEKIYELAELVYQIMDAGATEQEVDEYVESQSSHDDYEFYQANKDAIFDTLQSSDDEDDWLFDDGEIDHEIDPKLGPYGHDNPGTIENNEMDESYVMESLSEGCNCGGKRPRPVLPTVRRPGTPIKRPPIWATKGVRHFHESVDEIEMPTLNEKFIEKSDPIKDMGIGVNPKREAKKFFNEVGGNITTAAFKYFGGGMMQGNAEVLYGFFKNIQDGMTSQDAFYESCDDENLYGSREDVVEDRIKIANVIKDQFNIDVNYNDERLMSESKDEIFMNSLNEVDYEWMARNNREDTRSPRFAYGQRTYVDPKKAMKNTAPEYDYNERKSALGHIGRKQEILKDMGYDLDDEIEMPEIAPTKKEIKTLSPKNKQFPENKFNKLKSEYNREEILMDRLFKQHKSPKFESVEEAFGSRGRNKANQTHGFAFRNALKKEERGPQIEDDENLDDDPMKDVHETASRIAHIINSAFPKMRVEPSSLGRTNDGGQNVAVMDSNTKVEYKFEITAEGGVFYRGKSGQFTVSRHLGNINDVDKMQIGILRWVHLDEIARRGFGDDYGDHVMVKKTCTDQERELYDGDDPDKPDEDDKKDSYKNRFNKIVDITK